MRPIRAFLFSRDEFGSWKCGVFRDFEPLFEAAIAANHEKKYSVGIHIGFERPDTDAVGALLSKQDGLVFLSGGAIGTMPSPIKASRISIGDADGYHFHVAIDGFGYQIEDDGEDSKNLLDPGDESRRVPKAAPSGWLSTLATRNSQLFQMLSEQGIEDDNSYMQHEFKLDFDTRLLAALERFEILEGEQPNAATLIDRLKSAPPWLLGVSIMRLNLSVRSSNVCAAHKIATIEDLGKFGLKGLYKLPNLGRKSVYEISREIIRMFTTGQPLKIAAHQQTPSDTTEPERKDSNLGDDIEVADSDDSRSNQSDPLKSKIFDGFDDAAKLLTANERSVWISRLGFRSEPMTLQQIADRIGLTRERVRQIEVKIFKKLSQHPFWDELSRRVSDHLRDRSAPLFMNGLSAIDPWFDGIEGLFHPLKEVSDRLPLGFHVLTWNESPVISRMSQAQWLEAVDKAKNMAMAISDQNLLERDVLSQATGFLIGKGEDMQEAMQEEILKFCNWSNRPDGSRILTGVGSSATALVLGVLQASDTPLHIDEIERRVRSYPAYKATNVRNTHRAASEVGLLFGRGVYGLLKHCPLTPTQMQEICAEAEDIVAGGSSSRQWHSNEILEELLNRGFSYDGELTKYIVNIALAESKSLVYLRRMIWGVRGQWSDNADARLDVKQAIISLLEDEGKPMSTAQIRAKLIEGRGLNTYFQIWPSSPLIRLGPGLWGLEDRDVNMDHARQTAYRLLKELTARQEGMHISEVAGFLSLRSEGEVSTLVSVAHKDGLRIDQGQYCYLQPWGESRRVSTLAAVTSTLKAHPNGLTRTNLQMCVDRLIKRKLDRQNLSAALQNVDAEYDAQSALWKLSEQANNAIEDDEVAVDTDAEA